MARARLFLIDTYGFIFRAFHARARSGAPPMRTSAGLPTEAVYIFNNMMRKLTASYKPEYIAAVFEAGPSFREQEFADYKANRAEMPEDLARQIPHIRRLLEAMRVKVLECPGFEADDVIGAIAVRAKQAGVEAVIVSSDKDLLQLVGENVSMLNPAKDDLWFDAAKVEEFLGVKPSQVADLLALKGDAVDNIPGAPGIGDKGARDLIARFGSVEAALDNAAQVERKSYRESLQANREQILLSKRLATVETNVPVEIQLEEVAAKPPDPAALREAYQELEFFSLLKELGDEREARPREHRTLESPRAIEEWLAAIPEGVPLSVAISGGEESGMFSAGENARIGLAWRTGEAAAVPGALLGEVRGVLEDARRPKIAHDIKAVSNTLARLGVQARGFTADPMLYAFLLDADPAGCSLDDLTNRHLHRKPEPAAEDRAARALELAALLGPEVETRGFGDLYRRIDLPLVPVLAQMERTGIRIDTAELQRLSALMETEIQRLSGEIHALAGKPFNINSPQQLGKVLFDEMQLPAPASRGKGKAVSTAAEVLEELAEEHEIARKVLGFRQISKLKNTYVDAFPELIDPQTGRLHTSFNQTGAATGRLSSSNPNLQNIPIKTELGREIRAAFVPREGWEMLVADYSQIELRLLAHMSRDPVLVEAFRNGEDIHTRTAAEVFGVPPLLVGPEQRRNAKAVNFGIVYGLSAFGLSAQIGVSRQEAQSYIQSYFERYAGVRKFLDATIAEVRRRGATRTLFGRERPIPEINGRNPNARGFAERTAVNTPLQGTAADLIKLAMIRIDGELREQGFQAAMLLQVHDELVFEAPPEEMERLGRLVKSAMETVYKLEVPLVADIGHGGNWRDAK